MCRPALDGQPIESLGGRGAYFGLFQYPLAGGFADAAAAFPLTRPSLIKAGLRRRGGGLAGS